MMMTEDSNCEHIEPCLDCELGGSMLPHSACVVKVLLCHRRKPKPGISYLFTVILESIGRHTLDSNMTLEQTALQLC